MEIDRPTAVVNESIRRQVDKCANCPNLRIDSELGEDPEQVRRIVALATAIYKITQTIHLN